MVKSEGNRVFQELTKEIDKWLLIYSESLVLHNTPESSECHQYSFSIPKNGSVLGFNHPAYPDIFELYQKGQQILSKKIDDFTSHFYVNGMLFDRFTLNKTEYELANSNRIDHYDQIEACRALIPIFGLEAVR